MSSARDSLDALAWDAMLAQVREGERREREADTRRRAAKAQALLNGTRWWSRVRAYQEAIEEG